MKRIDLSAALKRSGYQVMLCTTYTIDLHFFEQLFLRGLTENECTYIGIFADQAKLNEHVQIQQGMIHLGKKYVVKGIPMNGAFHPKIYLSLGKKGATLIIGSGNLTPPGVITNAELFGSFDYDHSLQNDATNEAHLSLIQAAFSLLKAYHETNPSIAMKPLFQQAETYGYLIKPVNPASHLQLLHNESASLFHQIKPLLPMDIQRIHVFTPYFDHKLAVIKQLHRSYPAAAITVYLQDQWSNFPRQVTLPDQVECLEVKYTQMKKRRYHGKLFLFEGTESETLVYGSANCSRPAMLLTRGEGGNAEAVMVENVPRGTIADWIEQEAAVSPLYDEFKVISAEEGDSPHTPVSITFVEAIQDQEVFRLFLATEVDILSVVIDEVPGQVQQDGSAVEITWQTLPNLLPTVFSFTVTTRHDTVSMVGWQHNTYELEYHQTRRAASLQERLKNNPDFTDYLLLLQIWEELPELLKLDIDDMTRTSEELAYHKKLKQAEWELEEGVEPSENTEDYYVEDDFATEKKRIQMVRDHVDLLLRVWYEQQFGTPGETGDHHDKEEKQAVKTIEKSLKGIDETPLPPKIKDQIQHKMTRFEKKLRSSLTNPLYLEQVNLEDLIYNILVYHTLLEVLATKALPYQIIQRDQLMTAWIEVFKALITHIELHGNHDEKIDSHLIPRLLAGIAGRVESLMEEDDFAQVRYEKKELGLLLKTIHKKVSPIRETFALGSELLDDTMRCYQALKREVATVDRYTLHQWIDDLFPFKTYNQFVDWADSEFDMMAGLEVNRPEVNIQATYTKLDVGLYKRILTLLSEMVVVDEWTNEKRYRICLSNKDEKAHIMLLEYIFIADQRELRQKIQYRSANPQIYVKRFVDYSHIMNAAEQDKDSFVSHGFKRVIT